MYKVTTYYDPNTDEIVITSLAMKDMYRLPGLIAHELAHRHLFLNHKIIRYLGTLPLINNIEYLMEELFVSIWYWKKFIIRQEEKQCLSKHQQ